MIKKSLLIISLSLLFKCILYFLFLLLLAIKSTLNLSVQPWMITDAIPPTNTLSFHIFAFLKCRDLFYRYEEPSESRISL